MQVNSWKLIPSDDEGVARLLCYSACNVMEKKCGFRSQEMMLELIAAAAEWGMLGATSLQRRHFILAAPPYPIHRITKTLHNGNCTCTITI